MRRVRNALAAIGALILLIVFTPVVEWGTRLLAAPWGNEQAEVLVVLGGDMLIPGDGPDATLGTDTYLRCTQAAVLARQVPYRHIVVTGAWGLAHSMKRFLVTQGIDARRILEENAARSTFENAQYTRRILSAIYGHDGIPRVVVLTSDFHSRRALATFRRAGFQADVLPAPDLIKRCSTRAFRLEGAERLAIELAALASYKWKGYA